MSTIVKNYFRVLYVIGSLNTAFITEIRAALSLTSEFMSIDNENSFLNQ